MNSEKNNENNEADESNDAADDANDANDANEGDEVNKVNKTSETVESLEVVNFGILICGSGQGMAMAANRYPGIRAALCWKRRKRHSDKKAQQCQCALFGRTYYGS